MKGENKRENKEDNGVTKQKAKENEKRGTRVKRKRKMRGVQMGTQGRK